jgi:hypothetical protein
MELKAVSSIKNSIIVFHVSLISDAVFDIYFLG